MIAIGIIKISVREVFLAYGACFVSLTLSAGLPLQHAATNRPRLSHVVPDTPAPAKDGIACKVIKG